MTSHKTVSATVRDSDKSRLSITSWLSLPASETVPPPVTTRCQVLPVHLLGWENFERLCLRVLKQTQEIEQVSAPGGRASVTRLYGNRGQAQQGIDVYSRDPLPLNAEPPERPAVCLQARRLQKVSKTGIKNAVTDFLKGTWAPTSRKFIYATSASGIATEFTDEIETQARRLAKANIELAVWDEEEISDLLRSSPELVDDFFGRPWVAAFFGAETADRLGPRLDGEQVAALRSELRQIYSAAFGLADPGMVPSSTTAAAGVPLAERFVTPDLRPLRATEAYVKDSPPSPPTEAGTPEQASDSAPGLSDSLYSHLDEASLTGRGSLDGDWLGFGSTPGRSGETSRIGVTRADEWLGHGRTQVVIGEPGAGKSTLLRHLVLDLLSDEPVWSEVAERWGCRLPVWLPFHFFTQRVTGMSGEEASVVQAIRAWVEQHDIGHAWPLIQQALDDDRLLLIVDGLDEWSEIEAGEYAAAALERFAAARSIALVVSTRPYGLQRLALGPGWEYARIASLSPAQQRSMAAAYFEHGLADSARTDPAVDTALAAFMSEIDASPDLRAMAGIPLFLVLLVSLRLATGARLPNRRFEVFERAIQLLVAEHPTRRRVAAAVTMSRRGLRERQLRAVMAHVAFEAQVRGDVGAIAEQHLRQDLIAALRDPDVLALDQASAIQQADAIADIAEGELGLLVRQGPREVAFIHRCLQEQLAAEHISTRLSRAEQHKLLLNRLGDERWREVLLGVMWLTSRPDERRDLAEELVAHVNDTPVGLHAAEVVSEIVFGPFDLPGALSREQARFLADRIETHPVLSHRARLLAHFTTGVDSVAVRELVAERLRAWTGLTEPPRGALVLQLGQIPTTGATTFGVVPSIIEALGHLDPEIVWAAARVLIDRLTSASVDGDELAYARRAVAEILASPSSAASAAAALAVLCSVWPDEDHTCKAVESYRHSLSGAARMVALAHLLGVLHDGLMGEEADPSPAVDRLTEDERAWLHAQVSDRSDRGGHGGIDRAAINAAARATPQTLAHVLKRMKEGSGPDLDSVWSVALSAFSTELQVVEFVAEQIANEERPWPLLSVGFGRGQLALAFGPQSPHRQVIADAIETHLERFNTAHREMELHELAAIDQGPRMRSALLRALAESTVPHWAASALLDHFAEDPEVVSKLEEALTSDPTTAARLGSFAGRVLGHERGRHRLLEVLRELEAKPALQRQARYDTIASGLIDCCQDLTDPGVREEVCAEVLSLMPSGQRRWDGDAAFDLAVHLYPCPSAERILEERAERPGGTHLPGLLFAYRNVPAANAPLIERATALLRVPPPSIRYAINDLLSTELAPPELTLSCCASWADESSEPVKSMASLAYHRALASERVRGNVSEEAWSDRLNHLGDVASSYGPDHEARRRAAWIGMCVIGDWSPIDARVETIGNPNPVGVSLGDPLSGPDDILLDQLGHRWTDLRAHFGAELITRLSGLRAESPESSTWGHLATVASRFAALDADLRRAVDADPQLLSEEGVMTWYVADQRRSRTAATETVGGHIAAENNSRNAAVRIAQAPEAAGLDTSRLIEIVAEHADRDTSWYGNASLETLAVLQPSHPLVQRAWAEIRAVIGYGLPNDAPPSHDEGHDVDDEYELDRSSFHVQTYLAVAYSCIASEDVGWLVIRDLYWMAQRGDELTTTNHRSSGTCVGDSEPTPPLRSRCTPRP